MATGSGVGYPIGGIVPSVSTGGYYASAISLATYAQIIGYRECAFFGVSHPDNERFGCREIWTKQNRDEISRYLVEAQEEIEKVVGYPMQQKWIVGEKHKLKLKILTKSTRLISPGVLSITDLFSGLSVNYATDPAIITSPTTLTATEGIIVVYPGTSIEIEPSQIEISIGVLEIQIPKCRLIAFDNLDNPEEGWEYADDTKFQTTVDVKLVATDLSEQATLIWPHDCYGGACSVCEEYTQTACMYMRYPEIGSVTVVPASYSGGVWTHNSSTCKGLPEMVKLNYTAGLQTLDRHAETMIVRLAHAKMPMALCGCDAGQYMWRRDQNVPQLLTKERLECPFGLNDGAWIAWKFATSMTDFRAGTL